MATATGAPLAASRGASLVATAAGTAMAVKRGALLAAATGVAVALAVAVARGAALLAAATGVAVAVAVARAGAAEAVATATSGAASPASISTKSSRTSLEAHNAPTRAPRGARDSTKSIMSRYRTELSLISSRYMYRRAELVEKNVTSRTVGDFSALLLSLVLGTQAPVGAIEEGALFACTTGGDRAGVA